LLSLPGIIAVLTCSSCVAVSEGRITKSTPSKKTPKKDALKLEAMENSFSSSMMDGDDFADSVHGGFGALDFEDGMADMLLWLYFSSSMPTLAGKAMIDDV
jgi:hypothetical protein